MGSAMLFARTEKSFAEDQSFNRIRIMHSRDLRDVRYLFFNAPRIKVRVRKNLAAA
jgi:hypothetical protein